MRNGIYKEWNGSPGFKILYDYKLAHDYSWVSREDLFHVEYDSCSGTFSAQFGIHNFELYHEEPVKRALLSTNLTRESYRRLSSTGHQFSKFVLENKEKELDKEYTTYHELL
jgi:hypothetical protein